MVILCSKLAVFKYLNTLYCTYAWHSTLLDEKYVTLNITCNGISIDVIDQIDEGQNCQRNPFRSPYKVWTFGTLVIL